MSSSSSFIKPSLQSNSLPSNGILKRSNGSRQYSSQIQLKIQNLKSLHNKSANCFLYRDFINVAIHLEEANNIINEDDFDSEAGVKSGYNSREWFDFIVKKKKAAVGDGSGIEDDDEEEEEKYLLREQIRKLEILKITFLATTYGLPELSMLPNSITNSTSTSTISTLLQSSSPQILLSTLWHNVLPSTISTVEDSKDILATPNADFLHPSIIIALTLASLKLLQPRSARSITESYLGSISEEIESYLESISTDLNLIEFPLFNGGGSNSTQDLSLSTSTLDQNGNTSRTTSRSFSVNGGVGSDLSITLLSNYLKILDLLTLHVLPGLNEWEASEDFLRGQSIENGGWIDEGRITLALNQLSILHENSIAASVAQLEQDKIRAKSFESARLIQQQQEKEKSKQKSSSSKPRSPTKSSPPLSSSITINDNEDGFFKSTTPSVVSNTSTNKSKHSRTTSSTAILPSAQPTGFASLRSTLSSYLAQSPPTTTTATTITNIQQPKSFIRTLINLLTNTSITTDPVKLLSIICFAVAFTSWIRKKRLAMLTGGGGGRRGGEGLGVRKGLGKMFGLIKETARMGTRVTSL